MQHDNVKSYSSEEASLQKNSISGSCFRILLELRPICAKIIIIIPEKRSGEGEGKKTYSHLWIFLIYEHLDIQVLVHAQGIVCTFCIKE